MKRNQIIGVIVVLIIIIAAVWNVNKPAEAETLKIGVISSLTGDFGAVGENLVKGIRVGEMLYEKKTGKQVDLVVEDDGGDGAKGLSAYQKLSQIDHVEGLINFFTTTMDSIYGPSKTADYPLMMVAFQANNVADDHVFQTSPGNDDVWPKFAQYIKENGYDLSNFVLVHSKDAAQESFAKSFAKIYGEKSTLYVTSSNKNDLRGDAAKIIALKPTTILFFMTPDNGALLTKELLAVNTKAKLIYDMQLVTGVTNYQNILGDLTKIEGTITLFPEGELDKEFIDEYHELYKGEEPGFLADYGYDTFNVYMKTYDKDSTKWTANLKNFEGMGASGQIKFNKEGVRLPDLVIKKVVGGKLSNITRLPL